MTRFFWCIILLLVTTASAREFTIDLWDWTPPCRDLPTFKTWCADLKKLGATRVEFSAPWNLLEPKRGEYDLSFITDRVAAAKSAGLGARIRINSYHSGATPAWYRDELGGDLWRDINGNPPAGLAHAPPSITDRRFWQSYGMLCTRIAASLKGEDVFYSPFIGVHAELKFGDWCSYDASTLELWKLYVRKRPPWLTDIAGRTPLPAVPLIPPETTGTPDTAPAHLAAIAFREQIWRDAVRRFGEALHAGDANAKISVPLGESFRRGSAQMSNLDYFGLSRGAAQIVHSYDFFWHTKDDPWQAAAAVASFRGITGIDDITFEFDGPNLVTELGYDEAHQVRIADAALAQNAGLKGSNYSYGEKLPSTYPVLSAFAQRVATTQPLASSRPTNATVLLFISKWCNYCYREKTEWLHDAQFGAWHMLTSHDVAVRIICEDNLDEDLSQYHGMYVAFSPPQLIPAKQRAQLKDLIGKLPCIVELDSIPAAPPSQRLVAPPHVREGDKIILHHPFAWSWLHAQKNRPGLDHQLDTCIRETWGRRR